MVAHATLAVIAALALVSGAGVAAAVGTGMLHIGGGNGALDLGALTPGETGNMSIKSTVYLNETGLYTLEMEKEDQINSVFSAFQITVSVNGSTYSPANGNNENAPIHLGSGSHTFTVKLAYTVDSTAHSANLTDAAFLFLHMSGNSSKVAATGHEIPAAGGNISGDSRGGMFTLAYLDFSVNGTPASSGEPVETKDSLAVH